MNNYHDTESLEYSSDTSDDGRFSPHPTGRIKRYTRPLIDYVRNEWQTNAKYSHLANPDQPSEPSRFVQLFLSIVTAPRFRRYVVVYLVLVITCLLGWLYILSPRLAEHASLLRALDPEVKEEVGGWFGTNAFPGFDDVVQVGKLDKELLPEGDERLIVVGDVQGCMAELDRLLEELLFDPTNDHLIFTGNMISQGPNSTDVVDFARKYSASCVRGNNEDRVLVMRHNMIEAQTLTDTSSDQYLDGQSTEQAKNERKLARALSDEQSEWLDACPVILNVGQIPTMGQVAVVHGGLIPGVDLNHQDPYSVMNMLTLDLDTHMPSPERDGMMWTKFFNKHQSVSYSSSKSSNNDDDEDAGAVKATTVIYGHDSETGLNINTYTKGIDTGCVAGGKLTAFVISASGEQNIIQVRCNNYLP